MIYLWQHKVTKPPITINIVGMNWSYEHLQRKINPMYYKKHMLILLYCTKGKKCYSQEIVHILLGILMEDLSMWMTSLHMSKTLHNVEYNTYTKWWLVDYFMTLHSHFSSLPDHLTKQFPFPVPRTNFYILHFPFFSQNFMPSRTNWLDKVISHEIV